MPSSVAERSALSFARHRRLRRTPALRSLVREHRIDPRALVLPVFVDARITAPEAIDALSGHARWPAREIGRVAERAAAAGIGGLLLFGLPDAKDETGTTASDPLGPVPDALRRLRAATPDLALIADVCLCEYTSHGHCGVLDGQGGVDNDATLPLLTSAAVAYAQAGADIVAPSDMMDGRVAAIRAGLDGNAHQGTAILSYSAKYASAYYGPFRDAAQCAPQDGDRTGYQMDPPNAREALAELASDIAEGADMVMVKPAGPYLDVIAGARARFDVPLAAYQVSGEYAAICAAAERGWMDRRGAAMESLVGIARAGADVIITYFALEVAGWS
ncbi:MAG TPA: porphobilinogen synthase [Candidatus Limnocylindria bacterium]|nr:porphobilinogen synthase [Candidatus Limnocylindria bacterium]